MSGSKWKQVIGDPDVGEAILVAYKDEAGRLQEMRFSKDGQSIRTVSDDSAQLGDRQVPKWIELTASGGGGPDTKIRVEIRDGSPEVVELSWNSQPGQRDIRQKDLREINVEKLAVDTYTTSGMVPFPKGPGGSPPTDEQITEWAKEIRKRRAGSRSFVARQRATRERRVISDEFLQSVAEVYRANINKRAPTQEVAKQFGVENRMASVYVTKAREKGFLPKTKRGRKKA